jgi:hypothetical protein
MAARLFRKMMNRYWALKRRIRAAIDPTDIPRMPALLTLSLPLSTDFGNAKP